MTRRPTASTALPALAAALALALSGCGGGGGGGGPTGPGGQSDSPPQTGTDSTPTPPATPEEDPERPATPATTGGGGGSGGSGTSGQTQMKDCPDGSTVAQSATCPPQTPPAPTLTGIPWDHDDDGTTPDEPYMFEESYTIPTIPDLKDDDPDTDEDERMVSETERTKAETERTKAIALVKRDSQYADLTARDIASRIDDIRAGGDVGNIDPASLAGWADAGMVRAIIVNARGVSMGLDDAAREDIGLIDKELKRLPLLLAVAQRAEEALEEEEGRLRRRVTELEDDAREKDTDAADREREIQGDDPDYDGPTIDSLTTMADALNIEITTLKDEIFDSVAEKTSVDDWLAHYADGANRPDGDNPAGCTDAATCRVRSAELGAEVDPKQKVIDDKAAEETDLRGRITALEQEVTDLRAEATELRTQAGTALTAADELASAIAAATARVDAIVGEEMRVRDRHATERGTVRAGVPAVRVQDRLREIAGMADPGPARLVGRTGNIADIDAAGDRVFVRAERPGTAPEDALRRFAGINGAEVRRDTLNAPAPSADPSAEAELYAQQVELQTLATNLGAHWRMTVSDFLLADTDLDTADRQTGNARGDSVAGTFRGVHGTFYCDGIQCSELTATTFRNGWYFTPSVVDGTGGDPTTYRYRAGANVTYQPLHYADYGMWLTDTGSGIEVEARAALIGPDPTGRGNVDLTTQGDAVNRLAASATYSGTARGLSARSQYKDSDYVTASGHFTANVELNATFGGTPTLGGTIGNFRSADPDAQGTDHVNPAWSLTLEGWSPASGDAAGGLGTFDDGDAGTRETAEGHWSAWMHGETGRRPDGVYGGFTAAFRDDDVDQNPDGTNGDGTVTPGPDNDLFDDGAAIGVFSAD